MLIHAEVRFFRAIRDGLVHRVLVIENEKFFCNEHCEWPDIGKIEIVLLNNEEYEFCVDCN